MKYCVKCGNELHDEAVICPKCGCAVEDIFYGAMKKQKKAPYYAENNNKLIGEENNYNSNALSILNFIFSITLITSILCIALSIISLQIDINVNRITISGNRVVTDVYAFEDWGYSTSLIALIASGVSFIGFIINSILFFAKVKNKSLDSIFKTILKILVVAIVFVISLYIYIRVC